MSSNASNGIYMSIILQLFKYISNQITIDLSCCYFPNFAVIDRVTISLHSVYRSRIFKSMNLYSKESLKLQSFIKPDKYFFLSHGHSMTSQLACIYRTVLFTHRKVSFKHERMKNGIILPSQIRISVNDHAKFERKSWFT